MGAGPLTGVKAIEIAGIGPAPFCAMILADLGAEILRIDPVHEADDPLSYLRQNIVLRGRRSVAIDLKSAEGRALLLRLAAQSDLLIEGFRPGTMERLGLGPDDVAKANPKLVYGRMTGWGQDGPLSASAGHDLNFIALAGALHPMGPANDVPSPPLNLVGDYGGGGMMLAMGLLAGYIEAQRSGRGQVVDAAMVDGAALMMTIFHGLRATGHWSDTRGSNILDGGAPWYRVYRTRDDKFVSVGAVEEKFYRQLIALLGINAASLPDRHDKTRWGELEAVFTQAFASRTQAEWCNILEGGNACFAPVLTLAEVAQHPHMAARGTIARHDGIDQPAPAPRFSRTPGAIGGGVSAQGADTQAALADWGIAKIEIADLAQRGIVGVKT